MLRRCGVRVLIIGATGVIGSRVVAALIARGDAVSAVSRSPENRKRLEAAGARAVDVDLFDSAALAAQLAGHDAVVNLATHVPPSSRALLPGAWRATNALRRTLPPRVAAAAAAARVARYVQESFAPVYPDRGDRWIDENVPIRPARYNRGVAAAEAAALSFPGGVVLRFGYFYGPDSDFTRDMIAMVRRGWSPLPGRPEAYTSPVSHDDAAGAVVAALGVPAGIYNVVDDEPVTHREFAGSLAALLGVRPPKFAPAWTARLLGSIGQTLARSQRISNRKLRGASAWAPKFPSVREGWRAIL